MGQAELDQSDPLGVDPGALETIVAAMRCPICGGTMAWDAPVVRCPEGHAVVTHDGYLDASSAETPDRATAQTFESFGYEWTTFSQSLDEDRDFAEHYLHDLDLTGLDGQLGLDAGCGRGRYSRFLAEHLGALVALDGSAAAGVAASNLRHLANTLVVRSDLRHAPFADDSFGFVSSLGVLHHLEDPRAGFDRLVRLLAPGGVMLIYLYSRPDRPGPRSWGLAAAAALRRVTVRLPHRTLRALCVPLAGVLYATVVLGGQLGERTGIRTLSELPMATYRHKPARSLVLDTFDRLSAPIEHRYVWSDLAPWFDQSGLVVDAARDESGWFVVAHRPAG
jgi:SAM-dependent methyltransferase